MFKPEIQQATSLPTSTGSVKPPLIKEIPAVQPPLWKPEAKLKKVFQRAPRPNVCYQRRLPDTVSSLNLMNPELINLAQGWLQGYMDLLLSDRERLFQGQEENKIKSQLKKLLEKCRGKRINLKGLTR